MIRIEIPVTSDRRASAISYCFLRVKDWWPDAVIDAGGTPIRDHVSLVMRHVQACSLYRHLDQYYSARLFCCLCPRLQIEQRGDHLVIEGSGGAEDVAERLAKLPFWSYKVSGSERVDTICPSEK